MADTNVAIMGPFGRLRVYLTGTNERAKVQIYVCGCRL